MIVLVAGQLILASAWLVRSDKALSDFPAFYAAARIWERGEQPYSLENQCREQIPFNRAECLPLAHPPVLLPLISSLATDDFVASYWRWTALSFCVLLLCLIPLYKLMGPTSLYAILFQPIIASLWMGQDNAFVFAAVAYWIWLLLSGRDFLSGLALSLSVVKPHIAIALAIPLLFSRPKAFLGFCAGGAVLTAVSFALVGSEGFRGLLSITRAMAEGKGLGVWVEGMSNVTGLLIRMGVSVKWSWAFFIAGIALTSFIFRWRGVTRESVSLALITTFFTAPHIHPWDIGPLAIPLGFVGPMALLLASGFLYFLMPFRLLHIGCYVIMAALLVWIFMRSSFLRR
jgi:hypothetical protein